IKKASDYIQVEDKHADKMIDLYANKKTSKDATATSATTREDTSKIMLQPTFIKKLTSPWS
ncbi:hypothetical protein, partial [Staphylococcus aureus]